MFITEVQQLGDSETPPAIKLYLHSLLRFTFGPNLRAPPPNPRNCPFSTHVSSSTHHKSDKSLGPYSIVPTKPFPVEIMDARTPNKSRTASGKQKHIVYKPPMLNSSGICSRNLCNCEENSLVAGVADRRRETGTFFDQQPSSLAAILLTKATFAPVTVAGGCSCDPSRPVVRDRFPAVAALETLSASPATVTVHRVTSPPVNFVGGCSSDPPGTVVLG